MTHKKAGAAIKQTPASLGNLAYFLGKVKLSTREPIQNA